VQTQKLRGNKSEMGKKKSLLGGKGHSKEEEKIM
jgi:hypothetical protein